MAPTTDDTSTTGVAGHVRVHDPPPAWDSKKLNYDSWRFEIELWDEMTRVEKKQRGRLVMMALPMDDPSCAREKVRLAVQNKEVDIKSDDGVKELLKELDKTFKKDDVSQLL